jgi:hypothetical protein
VISDDVVSGNAVIHLSATDSITLIGNHTADLHQTDFHYLRNDSYLFTHLTAPTLPSVVAISGGRRCHHREALWQIRALYATLVILIDLDPLRTVPPRFARAIVDTLFGCGYKFG